jgi:hypothetical protein
VPHWQQRKTISQSELMGDSARPADGAPPPTKATVASENPLNDHQAKVFSDPRVLLLMFAMVGMFAFQQYLPRYLGRVAERRADNNVRVPVPSKRSQ